MHGDQEGRFFHGYYDHYCFLPLYVFCGDQLLVSYLRPSNIDGAKHSWAILSLLVKRLRQQWPTVKIIFRGDSGFCRHRILSWCERNNVDFVVGLAGNSRLKEKSNDLRILSEGLYKYTKQKQREFDSFRYGAKSWSKQRRVIAKAEYSHRGEMENQIKEQQMQLLADRTSASYWWANQWRVLLSSLAYILLEHIRRTALKKSELASAQVWTIRLKLLKVGGIILRNTRCIRLLLSSSYPYQVLFQQVATQLQPRPG
ncbi:MAG: transposase [Gammaproteobacteria bacterium]|nr:transposase [Gammaproteobacteria bacterium]